MVRHVHVSQWSHDREDGGPLANLTGAGRKRTAEQTKVIADALISVLHEGAAGGDAVAVGYNQKGGIGVDHVSGEMQRAGGRAAN